VLFYYYIAVVRFSVLLYIRHVTCFVRWNTSWGGLNPSMTHLM